MGRKFIHLAVVAVLLILAFSGNASRGKAQAGDPYSLIDAVNNLRAANGLPAYQVNGILMSIAQAQSDYQASIGQWTHTGPGGTNRAQRAAAAGYGGGATFFISENVAAYADATVDEVVSSWMQDYEHINTMLGASYVDVGAGVAEADGIAYYTLEAAYVAGSGSYQPASTRTPGGPTVAPWYPVQTVTPMPDGSIVHVVQLGQNLDIISKAYGITRAEIMELNNLTSTSIIYEGDRLIIRKASTPGPTSTTTASSTPTRAGTPTHKPTRTPTQTPYPVSTATGVLLAESISQNGGPNTSDLIGTIMVIAIVGLAGGGIVLMVVGSLLQRRVKPDAD